MSDAGRYEVKVDLSNPNSSHTQLVLLTGEKKKVLDVGSATGYLSRALRDRGCAVTAVEVDPEAARLGQRFADRMIVGDIASLDLAATLGGERFDVVILGDVLEHLVDPAAVLERIRDRLAPGGYVVASIPNVAHGSVRLALLKGEFTYTSTGLLDETHVRFFTRESVEELFARSGYRITEWRRVTVDLFDTEVSVSREEFPSHVVEAVASAPEATTFQFVVRAIPASGPVPVSSESPQRRALESLWATEQRPRDDEILVETSRISDEDREAVRLAHERHQGPRGVRSINWFIPTFEHAHYGGIHTILRFAKRFRNAFGIENRFVVIGAVAEARFKEGITRAFPSLADSPIHVVDSAKAEQEVPKGDAAIATLWSTAYPMVRSRSADRYFYFVQDFEPMFYPAGSVYAVAEETYRLGLYGIVNGPTLKEVYRSYGGIAAYFTPCVDTTLFRPPDEPRDDDVFTVFLYARPGHPRNCYELAMASLRLAKQGLGDRLRVVAAGSEQQEQLEEDWIENLGMLPYRETAELYRRCHAGLALSVSMHPSYIPMELMASGALVVSNSNPANGWLLRDRENALLAPAIVEGLASALHAGLTDTDLRARLTERALEDVRSRHSDWEREIDAVHAYLCDPEAATTTPERPTPGESDALRGDLRLQVAEVQAELDNKVAVLRGKAEQIKEKDMAILQRDWMVSAQGKRIAELESSGALRLGRKLRRSIDSLAPFGTYRRAFLRLFRGGRFKPPLPPPKVPSGIVVQPGRRPDSYDLWLHRNQLDDERIADLRRTASELAYRPKVSVLIPTYNTDPRWLREAIDSVRAQIYDNWELCVADDGSSRRDTRTTLRRYRRGEPRIKVTFAKRNSGIVAASNAALAMATGEFVALLDHDDVLQPEALFEVVKALNERSDADFIYTDEDKIELDGRRAEPFFKPDWSPDLLGSLNYVTHLSVFRKELVEGLGGFRRGFDGSQDYDLILRVTEAADSIIHVPRPVYSWRKVPGSAAASSEAKPYAYEAAKRALQESLERRGYEGEVLDGPFTGHYRIRYRLRERPRVSIVVPTRDRLDLVAPCVESIRERTSYDNYELVIVDNDSHEPETREYLDRFDGRVIHHPGPFNFARIMNQTVEEIDTPMVLFLNNDTEVIEGEWLEAMLEHGQRPDVAAVGARLLFPDGTPQHEGILVGLGGGLAGNIVAERYGFGVAIRNVSAVTAACMLTRAEVFRELGGFDEGLAVAYNDVDFCLRAREKGYLIVYTPHALLYHKEGGSRGLDGGQPPEDRTRFRSRWRSYRDPYYNPNFDMERPFKLELEW
jgi:GT2 family glycosyltransferase/2-polyprenyl-3-methyl-5-hydroxy-6-metoxy-1,4-benzoquinol methylase/glycosyltransferase involved in cell wall biosynthesis